MKKKSQFEIETVLKLLLAVIVLLSLALAIWFFRDNLYLIVDKIKNIMRFRL